MWKTAAGVRALHGRERAVFLESVLTLYDFLRDAREGEQDHDVGVPIFDRIPLEDRRPVLLWMAEHVLGDLPAPPVRAWIAAAIGAVFAHLEAMVELQIESAEVAGEAPDTPWRHLVHHAWMERCFPQTDGMFPDGEGNKKNMHSTDVDGWRFKIEGLANEILENDDYLFEDILDVAPERAAETKEYLGIENEYFTDPPPAFSSRDRERLLSFHQRILREKPRP